MKNLWDKIKNLRIWAVLGSIFKKIGAFFAAVGHGISLGATAFALWFLRHLRAIVVVTAIAAVAVGTFLALFLTLPVKSVEIEGEVLLLEGETYANGFNIKATTKAGLVHREDVLPSMLSGLDPDAPGEQTVTVSYGKWRVPAKITVIALADVTLRVREGTMPDSFEPNDPFPTSGIFDLYYNGERIRSAPITKSSAPGFTTRLSKDYDLSLVYREGLSLPYHYTVLEVIESITPIGVLYAPQGVALTKNNAVGNMRFFVKYKDGTEEYVMIYDDRIFVQENVLAESDKDYQDEVVFIYKGVEVRSEVTAYHGELLAPKSVTLNLGKTVYMQGETFDYASAYVEVVYERFGSTPVLLRATQDMIFLAEWQGDPSSESGYAVPITDGSEPVVFDEVKYYTVLAYYNLALSQPLSLRVVSEEDSMRVTDLTTTWLGKKDGPPIKGQDLDFTDAQIRVEYGFGYRFENAPLTADMVTGYDKDVAGDQELTITYDDFFKVVSRRVGDPESNEVTGIFAVVAWNEVTYYTSDELVVPETAYLEVEIGYGGRENKRVYVKNNADVTITGFTPHTLDEQLLTLSYAGLTVTQRLILQDDRTEEINDFWAPNDIDYYVGTALDLSGYCTVFYSTGKQVKLKLSKVLEIGGRMEPVGFVDLSELVPGENYAVKFYYPGYDWSDHFTWIHVKGDAPVKAKGIRLDTTKSTYKVGEDLDLENTKLYLVYSDNSEEDVTDYLTESLFFGFDTTSTGNRSATVTYVSEHGSFATEFFYSVVE